MDDYEQWVRSAELKSRIADIISVSAAILLLGVMAFGACEMKNWRYDECLKVGHDKLYCDAEYVGCMGK